MHAPLRWEEGGEGGGSDGDGNSRTITAKDKCIIGYSSLIFMNFLVQMMSRYRRSMCACSSTDRRVDATLHILYVTGAAVLDGHMFLLLIYIN